MTKEERKEAFSCVLLILGFLLVTFTLILYLGDSCMKNCFILKIICTVMLATALGGGIIAIWCCKAEDSYPPLGICKKTTKYILDYDSAFAVIRGMKKSYSVKHFDSLESAVSEIHDGDTLCIFDSEVEISEKTLNELFSKQEKLKNLTIKFMKTEKCDVIHLNK